MQLVSLLANPNSQLRIAGLRQIRPDEVEVPLILPGLLSCLKDEDPRVRRSAVNALGRIASRVPDGLDRLVDLFSDSDKFVRQYSRRSLLHLQEAAEAVLPRLIELVDANQLFARIESIRALGDLRRAPERVIPKLMQALRETSDEKTRYSAAASLGRFGRQAREAVPLLTSCLNQGNPYLQANAALALAQIGIDAAPALPELAAQFRNASGDLGARYWAAIAIGHLAANNREYLHLLLDNMNPNADKIGYLNRGIITAIARFSSFTDDALPRLFEILRCERNLDARILAARVAVKIQCGNRDEVEELLVDQIIGDSARKNRSVDAATILRKLGGESIMKARAALPLLIGRFRTGTDWHQRHWALKCLAELSPELEDAYSVLVEASKDSDVMIRVPAIVELSKVENRQRKSPSAKSV